MKTHNLAFIDIETTGLDFNTNEILEMGGIIVSQENNGGEYSYAVIDEFAYKVRPEHIETANRTALKINKYTEEDWSDAYPLQKAMEIFADKTAGTIMVAHNAPFDAAFIEKAFFDTGVKSRMHHYHKLDTISIAYAKLHDSANIEKFTLHELCEHFGIENKNEHSALSDARACFELYKKLMLL